MKRDIYDCGKKCQLAFNLDKLCAIDVTEEDGKWGLRLFFPGVERGYRLITGTKDVADNLYNDIVSRMKEVRSEEKAKRMRVKWYGMVFKGVAEGDMPLLEKDTSEVFEGEVVATVPSSDYKKNMLITCSCNFVVALDDNTFTEVPISMCERI